mmetsp:Transcript_57665/g.159502  ORF Transcript_57665/g.159502 Transcript_57665/m.159502 type:complete len:214 (+) Transcript_57665:346-987(+)
MTHLPPRLNVTVRALAPSTPGEVRVLWVSSGVLVHEVQLSHRLASIDLPSPPVAWAARAWLGAWAAPLLIRRNCSVASMARCKPLYTFLSVPLSVESPALLSCSMRPGPAASVFKEQFFDSLPMHVVRASAWAAMKLRRGNRQGNVPGPWYAASDGASSPSGTMPPECKLACSAALPWLLWASAGTSHPIAREGQNGGQREGREFRNQPTRQA